MRPVESLTVPVGPHIVCRSCQASVNLRLVERAGPWRGFTCPACEERHDWTVGLRRSYGAFNVNLHLSTHALQ